MTDPTTSAEILGLPVAVLSAVIAAAVAVVLAVVGQFETWRRERSARAYERRRTALLDAQDAAPDLRKELRKYGQALAAAVDEARPEPLGPTGALVAPMADDSDRADAAALLEVRQTRLEAKPLSQAVSSALNDWRDRAEEHFISPGDVTAGAELEAWQAVNAAVAAALA